MGRKSEKSLQNLHLDTQCVKFPNWHLRNLSSIDVDEKMDAEHNRENYLEEPVASGSHASALSDPAILNQPVRANVASQVASAHAKKGPNRIRRF
jgi:hypothetical protein